MDDNSNVFDVAILGCGPAGLTSAIYSSRYRMKTALVCKEIGGLASEAHLIENYPGFPSISGLELMKKFKEHLDNYDYSFISDEVIDVRKENNFFKVTARNSSFSSKSLIIAAGTIRKKLNIKGEEEFLGKGVSYCATCDAAFFSNKEVCVIGCNDAAVLSALLLAQSSSKVYLLCEKSSFEAEPIKVEQLLENDKIKIIINNKAKEITGDSVVRSLSLEREYNNQNKIDVSGVFIENGNVPNLVFVKELGINVDDEGLIIVDEKQSTNVPGVFAAGDVTSGSNKFKQVATAVGEGAVSADAVFSYISNINDKDNQSS